MASGKPGSSPPRRIPLANERSVSHAPIDPKTKLPICWDAACHIGCFRDPCPHSHEPLPPLNRLDYTVAMQVLRRGGPKNGPKINPKDVDGRIAQLRAQHQAEQDEKVSEAKAKAKAKAKGKTKAGWLVPEEYMGPVTAQEAELGDLALGPDHSWHQSYRNGSCTDDLPLTGEDASQRLQCLRSLQDQGLLEPLKDCTPYLRSRVASHLVNARLSGEDSLQVPEILQYAVDHGHPQLAEEAFKTLDHLSPAAKAGAAPRDVEAAFSGTRWDAEGLGRGELQLHQGPFRGLGSLPFVDFQDQLPLLSHTWFFEPIEVETRQCLCLHVAAALSGERSLSKARTKALVLRKEMLQESVDAFTHLGDAPPHVREAEAFVRHNAHDCFYPHHEKD